MANITQAAFQDAFFYENICILIHIFQNHSLNGVIVDESALGQVMAWHRTGDKPLPQLMLIKFHNAL